MSEKRKKKNDYQNYRSLPLYFSLACGIIVLLVGLYLFIADKTSEGVLYGKFNGGAKGINVTLTWYGAIIIGILVCAAPAYFLIRKATRKK